MGNLTGIAATQMTRNVMLYGNKCETEVNLLLARTPIRQPKSI